MRRKARVPFPEELANVIPQVVMSASSAHAVFMIALLAKDQAKTIVLDKAFVDLLKVLSN